MSSLGSSFSLRMKDNGKSHTPGSPDYHHAFSESGRWLSIEPISYHRVKALTAKDYDFASPYEFLGNLGSYQEIL